jgi:energy-coupling factor transporter ATP-binding protein EcfA2/uncharacterized membrane protein
LSGRVLLDGIPVEELDRRTAASAIGFVQQDPDNQIVTDKVWHELAFGLESLGFPTPVIRLRVAETASFFGIQDWFHRSVSELSGGQRQLLALASVMVMQPSVVVLDEPTAQLDPIAAEEFLTTLGKINTELGVSIVLSEHRLDQAFPMADKVLVLDGGRLVACGTPASVGETLRASHHPMFAALPAPMRIWAGVENALPCPVTVGEGRVWLDEVVEGSSRPVGIQDGSIRTKNAGDGNQAISITNAFFRYNGPEDDVIRGLTWSANFGEISAILGGNGTGKTTTLKLISGARKPQRGKVKLGPGSPTLALLPQNPQTLFVAKTVAEDLWELAKELPVDKEERKARIEHVVELCRLEALLESHPYDLSGGEQQRAALAKVLLLEPQILLLDEPTKGLDADFKNVLGGILTRLRNSGVAVVMVSHDIEFCAEWADQCALFFDGAVVSSGPPREFFAGNSYYTSAANRMARHLWPDAVTVDDVIRRVNESKPEATASLAQQQDLDPADEPSRSSSPPKSSPDLIRGDEAVWVAPPQIKSGDGEGGSWDGEGDTGDGEGGSGNGHESGSYPKPHEVQDPNPVQGESGKPASHPTTRRRSRALRRTVTVVSSLILAAAVLGIVQDPAAFATMISGGSETVLMARDPYLTTRYIAIMLALAIGLVGLTASLTKPKTASAASALLADMENREPNHELRDGEEPALGDDGRVAGSSGMNDLEVTAKTLSASTAPEGETRKLREAEMLAPGDAGRVVGSSGRNGQGLAANVPPASVAPVPPADTRSTKTKLPRRTILTAAIVLILVPLTLFVGLNYFGDRAYLLTSLLIVVETLVPFFAVFEGRKPQARELVVIATLVAIGVAGRAVFFMLPQFKPLVALVVIVAVAFGAETGFIVGALSALVSNMFFGQGPWTPWQMFALGIIGLLAGILFRKGILGSGRVALSCFGALAAVVIYGGIMNPASVLMYYSHPTGSMFLLAYLSGLPFDLVHAAATVFFLMVASQPMLDKLERIKVKYGLLVGSSI